MKLRAFSLVLWLPFLSPVVGTNGDGVGRWASTYINLACALHSDNVVVVMECAQVAVVVGTSRGMSATDVRRKQFEDVDVSLCRNAGVSREQLDQLRQDIRSSLNDTLFTRLHNMEEVYRVNTKK